MILWDLCALSIWLNAAFNDYRRVAKHSTYVCMSPKLTLSGKRVNRRTGHRLVITSLTPDLCMYLRQSFVFRNIFARKSKACSCPNYGEPFKIRYVPVWRTHLWLLYEIYALPTHPHTHTFIYTYSYIESNTLSGAVRATIWHWQAKPFLSFSCYDFGRVTTSHRCMCYMSGKHIYMCVCVCIARSTLLNAQ